MEEPWQTTIRPELETSLYENTTVVEVEHWRVVLETVTTVILTCSIIFLMLGMGCAISVMELWAHTKRPIGVVIGMVGQFAVMPAVGFCLSLGFKLRAYEALGVLIVSCCPGGYLSNLFTFWVDGDLALSIMMTVCSCLLAFGGMPFNLWLYGSYWRGGEGDNSFVIPYTNIIASLAIVTGPAIVGMVVRHFRKRPAEIITWVSSRLAWLLAAMLVIIWLILFWPVFMMATPLVYLVIVLFPAIGFILAFLLAKLACQNNQIGRTIGIETSVQNSLVALNIILLSFTEPDIKREMMLFPVLYPCFMIPEAIVGIVVYQLQKRLCKKDKCKPIMHTARLELATTAERETMLV